MRKTSLIALVLLASAAAISAQRGRGTGTGGQRGGGGGAPAEQQRPVFRGTTELVQIDVVVRDKDGNAVHGLTAADFEVFDRKSPQSVEVFKELQRTIDTTPAFSSHFPPTMKLDVASNRTGGV